MNSQTKSETEHDTRGGKSIGSWEPSSQKFFWISTFTENFTENF